MVRVSVHRIYSWRIHFQRYFFYLSDSRDNWLVEGAGSGGPLSAPLLHCPQDLHINALALSPIHSLPPPIVAKYVVWTDRLFVHVG